MRETTHHADEIVKWSWSVGSPFEMYARTNQDSWVIKLDTITSKLKAFLVDKVAAVNQNEPIFDLEYDT